MKPVRSSEFYNHLVRLMSTHGPSVPAPAPAQTSRAQDGPSRGRILVVEDNEVNQLVARATVSSLGYAVDVVSNGAEALSVTAGFRYAAVLMDCHMPVMDGFEATRRIRQRDGTHPRLPIIAMTAGALDGDRERCLAAGMDDYLAKPVDATALQATLVRWVPEPSAAAVTEPVPQPLAVTGTATRANPGPTSVLDQDRVAMLRQLGPEDGRGLLPEAAATFRRDLPARVDALQAAVHDGDGPALAQAAHALKGSAANIGGTAVAEICSELEGLGRRGMPDVGTPLIRRLEEQLQLLDAELDAALEVDP
jgi:CheY-like chemotaxis protein